MASTAREGRVELRMTSEEKTLLAAAAARERLDVTSFILRAVLPAAREVVSRPERIVLGEAAAEYILDLLENPPEPSPALVRAARLYLSHRIDD